MLQLKGKFMDDDGKGVNYGEMAASEDFAEYCGVRLFFFLEFIFSTHAAGGATSQC